MKKTFLAGAFALGSAFILTGCGGGDVQDLVNNVVDDLVDQNTYAVSGQVVKAADGTAIAGATVQARLVASPDNAIQSATSNASGNYSLTLPKSAPLFLNVSSAGYATMNTEVASLSSDVTGLDIDLPASDFVQPVIDTAYGTGTAFANKAWLVVDVYDNTTDAEIGNQTITVTAAPEKQVYTDCDGSDIGSAATVACADRSSPMYIASFPANTQVTVTVNGETKTAVVRTGEFTYVGFYQ